MNIIAIAESCDGDHGEVREHLSFGQRFQAIFTTEQGHICKW